VTLFRVPTVPEVLSFRALPSRRSRTPLEAAGFLAVIPDPLGCALQNLISAGFSSHTPRERGMPLNSPSTYEVPFNALTRVSRFSWASNNKLSHQDQFTDFEAFLPPRIRALRPEFPQT